MDYSDDMYMLIYSMHTQDNGGSHELYLNNRVQAPFTTNENLLLTRKSSKHPHMLVDSELIDGVDSQTPTYIRKTFHASTFQPYTFLSIGS